MVMTAGDACADTSPTLLGDHIDRQLRRLCRAVGLEGFQDLHAGLMREILGPAVTGAVDVTPAWESQISDDHTPVEFSISFD
ncbi:MAG: prenyltransferase, partial [Actinobacteria bacterium]